jgi:hydrogenase 3 maturation protease
MSKSKLKKWLSGFQKLAVVGIGNPLRMDDYVGMKIVEDLKGKLSKRVLLIESETVPESFLQQIIDFKPTHVLLIDAAVMGDKPGSVKIVEYSKLPDFSPVSSHALPLRIFCQYLQENLSVAIFLLLIEPKHTDFGEGLSHEVASSARRIEKLLMKYLSDIIKE